MANQKLNVAAICPCTEALGPGRRFAIWVQGCCLDCHNCSSPEWREMKEAVLVTVEDLSQRILRTRGIEGITISGGEPVLQAAGLHELIKNLRRRRPLTVICYTGFTLEELGSMESHGIKEFLSGIDVLIDGRYVESLNDNKGWRGSSNQRIHFLSGIYRDREDAFINRRRDTEIVLFEDHYLVVGIKPQHMVQGPEHTSIVVCHQGKTAEN